MIRKYLLFSIALLLGQYGFTQETIILGETPNRGICVINLDDGKALPLMAEVTFQYRQKDETVIMRMHFKGNEYTHLWIPSGDEICRSSCMAGFELPRKVMTNKILKKNRLFWDGLTCNGRQVPLSSCGFFPIDDTLVVEMTLDGEGVETLDIALNNVVPMVEKKSWETGWRKKICYVSYSKPVHWKVKLQRDPCKTSHNLALMKRVEWLIGETGKIQKNLDNATGAGMKEYREKCMSRVAALNDSLNSVTIAAGRAEQCNTIAKKLDEAKESLSKLEKTINKHEKVIDDFCDAKTVKYIKEKLGISKQELDNLNNKCIKAQRKKNTRLLEEAKSAANDLIYNTDKYIKGLSHECKTTKEVRKAIDEYNKLKDNFLKRYGSK